MIDFTQPDSASECRHASVGLNAEITAISQPETLFYMAVRYTNIKLISIAKLFLVSAGPCLLAINLSMAQPPQTHDVPMFHNDDGLGLLQDCTFMRAIAIGQITEIPTTVAGRSTSCLISIKSIAQVLYSIQNSITPPTHCLPSADLNWFELLEFLVSHLESQPPSKLPERAYGVWIMEALQQKYPCN